MADLWQQFLWEKKLASPPVHDTTTMGVAQGSDGRPVLGRLHWSSETGRRAELMEGFFRSVLRTSSSPSACAVFTEQAKKNGPAWRLGLEVDIEMPRTSLAAIRASAGDITAAISASGVVSSAATNASANGQEKNLAAETCADGDKRAAATNGITGFDLTASVLSNRTAIERHYEVVLEALRARYSFEHGTCIVLRRMGTSVKADGTHKTGLHFLFPGVVLVGDRTTSLVESALRWRVARTGKWDKFWYGSCEFIDPVPLRQGNLRQVFARKSHTAGEETMYVPFAEFHESGEHTWFSANTPLALLDEFLTKTTLPDGAASLSLFPSPRQMGSVWQALLRPALQSHEAFLHSRDKLTDSFLPTETRYWLKAGVLPVKIERLLLTTRNSAFFISDQQQHLRVTFSERNKQWWAVWWTYDPRTGDEHFFKGSKLDCSFAPIQSEQDDVTDVSEPLDLRCDKEVSVFTDPLNTPAEYLICPSNGGRVRWRGLEAEVVQEGSVQFDLQEILSSVARNYDRNPAEAFVLHTPPPLASLTTETGRFKPYRQLLQEQFIPPLLNSQSTDFFGQSFTNLVCVSGACSSGKSHLAVGMLAEHPHRTGLYICPRSQTVADMVLRLRQALRGRRVINYQDLVYRDGLPHTEHDGQLQSLQLRPGDVVCACLRSVHKLILRTEAARHHQLHFDIVIHDEVNTTVRDSTSDFYDSVRRRIDRALIKLVRDCDVWLSLDADFSVMYSVWLPAACYFSSSTHPLRPLRVVCLENHAFNPIKSQKRQMTVTDDEKYAKTQMMAALRLGKRVAVFFGSFARMNVWKGEAVNAGYKVVVKCGKKHVRQKASSGSDVREDLFAKRPDAFFYTTAAGVGVDVMLGEFLFKCVGSVEEAREVAVDHCVLATDRSLVGCVMHVDVYSDAVDAEVLRVGSLDCEGCLSEDQQRKVSEFAAKYCEQQSKKHLVVLYSGDISPQQPTLAVQKLIFDEIFAVLNPTMHPLEMRQALERVRHFHSCLVVVGKDDMKKREAVTYNSLVEQIEQQTPAWLMQDMLSASKLEEGVEELDLNNPNCVTALLHHCEMRAKEGRQAVLWTGLALQAGYVVRRCFADSTAGDKRELQRRLFEVTEGEMIVAAAEGTLAHNHVALLQNCGFYGSGDRPETTRFASVVPFCQHSQQHARVLRILHNMHVMIDCDGQWICYRPKLRAMLNPEHLVGSGDERAPGTQLGVLRGFGSSMEIAEMLYHLLRLCDIPYGLFQLRRYICEDAKKNRVCPLPQKARTRHDLLTQHSFPTLEGRNDEAQSGIEFIRELFGVYFQICRTVDKKASAAIPRNDADVPPFLCRLERGDDLLPKVAHLFVKSLLADSNITLFKASNRVTVDCKGELAKFVGLYWRWHRNGGGACGNFDVRCHSHYPQRQPLRGMDEADGEKRFYLADLVSVCDVWPAIMSRDEATVQHVGSKRRLMYTVLEGDSAALARKKRRLSSHLLLDTQSDTALAAPDQNHSSATGQGLVD